MRPLARIGQCRAELVREGGVFEQAGQVPICRPFVRWLVIDNGRRLMMVSDYDGSWENYIDEFAEMIASGLDALWETAIGLPLDGARDLPAFKHFLRTHQVPSDAFYSAYPDATVLNVQSETQRLEARRA